jgi:predicted transcriptional regulator
MSTLSIRLPEDLKAKAVQLAKKKKMSLDALVNYWLQTAVVQDETMEWMNRRLAGKNPELLIAEFGRFLEKTKPGSEPTWDEIQQAMKE